MREITMNERKVAHVVATQGLRLAYVREYVDHVDGKNVTTVKFETTPILATMVYDNDDTDYLIVDPMEFYPITVSESWRYLAEHRVVASAEEVTAEDRQSMIDEGAQHFAREALLRARKKTKKS
jgi:hypothetical protein